VQAPSPKKAVSLALRLAGCLGLAAAVAVLAAARPAQQTAKGAEACAACHEDVVKAFARNPHSAAGKTSCAACHDGAVQHLEEGGGQNILAYKASDLPSRKNKTCLACHAEGQARFAAGPHGQAALDCGSCHGIHGGKVNAALLRDKPTKTCAACHQDIMAKFQLNERHRLQEGILACTSCHDPHAPQAGSQTLGGFKQETCLKCHTDKGGPFLYEHGASRVEGCTICHEPHGSTNRHLLTTQSVPNLCFGCHVAAPSWHGRFDAKSTNCTSCHATIHGSNLSRIFLK
jgi:DmsE family decaheme c-type cytochrome